MLLCISTNHRKLRQLLSCLEKWLFTGGKVNLLKPYQNSSECRLFNCLNFKGTVLIRYACVPSPALLDARCLTRQSDMKAIYNRKWLQANTQLHTFPATPIEFLQCFMDTCDIHIIECSLKKLMSIHKTPIASFNCYILFPSPPMCLDLGLPGSWTVWEFLARIAYMLFVGYQFLSQSLYMQLSVLCIFNWNLMWFLLIIHVYFLFGCMDISSYCNCFTCSYIILIDSLMHFPVQLFVDHWLNIYQL